MNSGRRATAGLTAADAARRLVSEGANRLPGQTPKPTLAIVLGVLIEPMFLMLLAAGSLYLLLGDRAEALFLLGFVFVVIGMSLYQERRTQRALEALRDLSAPRALVLRDGQEQRVSGHEVVRGDVLVLHEGDLVAADARLLEGEVEVDESLLTGESVPVAKAVAEGRDRLFASTLVTRGLALAEVVSTAGRTAIGRIGADLQSTVEPPSALQLASRRLVRRVGALALALALSQALLAWWWNGQSLLPALLSGIALAMAVLPEEIPLIFTAFLALGALRIAQRQVLTRRLTAVEALGSITTLAVDKTGTLTVNRMAVAELATPGARFRAEDAGPLPPEFRSLLEAALMATPRDPFDPMEKAIRSFGAQWGVSAAAASGETDAEAPVHEARPAFEYPLTREILAMTRVFALPSGAHRLATKGAPEAVVDLCHLDASLREPVRLQVEAMATRGLRVLGVARGHWHGASGARGDTPSWPASQHDFDFEFLGLVGLADPPRPEVPEAVAQCRRAGVRVIMMTGDHPATACAIARQIGLSAQPELMTGSGIDALDDAALRSRLERVDLCARLRPEHKLRLVRVLRDAGEVVAMTGDGVNDAPALKAADVGVAMGQRGTDVAREAAALVLLDDSFARIVEAIGQGRRIYDNIGRAVRFVFAVHVPIVALVLVPTLLHWPAVLLPVHIVLLELLIDPACSVVFEAEPAAADLMERPPRARDDSPFGGPALLRSLLQGLGVSAALLAGHAWARATGWSLEAARALSLSGLVLAVGLLILANRQPQRSLLANLRTPNRWLRFMALAMVALLALILALPGLRALLQIAAPPAASALIAGAVIAGAVAWLEMLRLAAGRLRRSGVSPPASTG